MAVSSVSSSGVVHPGPRVGAFAGLGSAPSSPIGDTGGVNNSIRVVTVDMDGNPVGTADRLDAHKGEGLLHQAVSLQVMSTNGRWLVQQRAHAKPLFGGYWANTCCTHPLPGEAPVDAVRRRAGEELGLALVDVEPAGAFVYRAVDERTGLVEHEYDLVFVATVTEDVGLIPDPAEVASIVWLDSQALVERTGRPTAAPWFGRVVSLTSAAA